ncbi:protein kinase family protein [Rhizomonospora bruguierae]|uniref:protein kinase family protein n=1 Tax=Rhizomonospora bruguierae TaxID=1581705 RepID=UPI001BD13418|nr:protein kinase family protein [Micromonospora sp. NBRC 107566]
MTFGAPTAGEVLADRYRLEEHVNDDSAGRKVWRGVDVVLRRPVAVVLRYPGGESAAEMLKAAVTASRVVHPNLVGVYDAIDEEERAYVVREWVDGASLREHVADGVFDPERATTVAHAIASAVAAVHATGMEHGNIHPGSVLIANDGRVVLADARADGDATPESDVRAIGGVLYFALTSHWPHLEAGQRSLPDAVRDGTGALAAPRQIRAGVPAVLDELAMDLLDPQVTPPAADTLAAELARLDNAGEEPFYEEAGPLRFAEEDPATEPSRPPTRKIAMALGALLAIAVVGLLVAVNTLSGSGTPDEKPTVNPGAVAQAPSQDATGGSAGDDTGPPKTIKLSADQVRIVDPDGRRNELDDAGHMVDGKPDTAWTTDRYVTDSHFGKLKRGMGVLIDLGQERSVTSMRVELTATGTSARLLTGTAADPGSSKSGDNQVLNQYKTAIGDPFDDFDGTTMVFNGFSPDQKYRYLLLWITDLPSTRDGGFKTGISEITVQGR